MHSQHCTHLACQARSKTFRRKRSKMGRSHPAHCTMADPPRPPPPPGPPDKASPGVRVWRGPTLPADRSTAGLYVDAGVVDVVSRPRRAPTIKTMLSRRVSVFSSNSIIVTVRRKFPAVWRGRCRQQYTTISDDDSRVSTENNSLATSFTIQAMCTGVQ